MGGRGTLVTSSLIERPRAQRLFFGDGITRRSAKRSQAVQPPLERRGALSECRAPTKHYVGTGVVRERRIPPPVPGFQ